VGTYSKYADIISGKKVVKSTPTKTKYANIISSFQPKPTQPTQEFQQFQPIQPKKPRFPKLKAITKDFIKDIKLAKGYAKRVEGIAKQQTKQIGKQYASDLFETGKETAKRIQKLSPGYKAARQATGEPISFVENLKNYLGAGLGLAQLSYRTNPIAPVISATAGTIKANRQNLQKIKSGEEVTPEEVLTSSIRGAKKGLKDQPFVGEAITDNPTAQKLINIAFLALFVAKPFVSKKLSSLKLSSNEMAKVSKTLGVKPNASMETISKAYKTKIVQYKNVFAGKGTNAELTKVKELNDAYNILKKAGIWERKLAGLFGKVKPEEFKAVAIPEKAGVQGIANAPVDPKIIIDTTLTSNLVKTKAGQQALKLATAAQKNGNKIAVNLDGQGDVVLTTPEGEKIGLSEVKEKETQADGSGTTLPSKPTVAVNRPEALDQEPSLKTKSSIPLPSITSSRYTSPSHLINLDDNTVPIQSKVTTLIANSQENKATFISDIEKATGMKPDVRVKKPDSLKGKIGRYTDKGKKISEIADVLAGKIETTLSGVGGQIKNIENYFDTKEVENYFEAPSDWGYRGVNITVQLPNGTLSEIQVHTKNSWLAVQKMHKLYENWRDLDHEKLTPTQLKEMEADRQKSLKIAKSFEVQEPKPAPKPIKVTEPKVLNTEMNKKVISKYGTTNKEYNIGYITPEGQGIDMSLGGEYKNLSHKELANFIMPNSKTSLIDFQNQTGNIRVINANQNLNIDVPIDIGQPSSEQISKLKQMAGDKTIFFDLTDKKGNIIKSGSGKFNDFIDNLNSHLKIIKPIKVTEPKKVVKVEPKKVITPTLGKVKERIEEIKLEAKALAESAKEQRSLYSDANIRLAKRVVNSKGYQENDIEFIRKKISSEQNARIDDVVQEARLVNPDLTETDAIEAVANVPNKAETVVKRDAKIKELKKEQEDLEKQIAEIRSRPKPEGTGVSKIGRSIEQKAIERKLTKGFEGVAEFEKINVKNQRIRAEKILKDVERTRRILRGEEALPDNLKGISLITALEEQIANTYSPKLANDLSYELANSPLVSATSLAAQELRLAAERIPDSATVKIQQIKKNMDKKIRKADETKKKLKKRLKDEVKKDHLTTEEKSIDNFINSIIC